MLIHSEKTTLLGGCKGTHIEVGMNNMVSDEAHFVFLCVDCSNLLVCASCLPSTLVRRYVLLAVLALSSHYPDAMTKLFQHESIELCSECPNMYSAAETVP